MYLYFAKRACTSLARFLANFAPSDVLCPANVCYTVPATIQLAGHRPVFYDVDSVTGMGTLKSIQAKLTPERRIVLYVFQYGNLAGIEDLRDFAATNRIQLVLDYASCLITQDSVPPLNGNEVGLLSFGRTKQLELGYGGALAAGREIAYERGEEISPEGHRKADDAFEEYVDRNFVIDVNKIRQSGMAGALTADFGEGPLSKVRDFFHSSRSRSGKVSEHKLNIDRIFSTRIVENDSVAHYPHRSQYPRWRFNILSDKRDLILSKLMASKWYPPARICASKWYPPVHQRFGDSGEYPGARRHAERVLNLFNDKNTSVPAAYKISMIINHVSGGKK